jgi:hypothetical protein
MSGDDFFKFRDESSGSNVRRASGETRSRPTSLSGFTIPSESEYLPCANETIYLCNFRVSVDGDWLCLKELPDTVSTTVAGHQLRYEQMAITPELERMTRYPNYPLHGKGISISRNKVDRNYSQNHSNCVTVFSLTVLWVLDILFLLLLLQQLQMLPKL